MATTPPPAPGVHAPRRLPTHRLLGGSSRGFVTAIIAATTMFGWLVGLRFSGVAIIAPYWLCVPVLIAAARFGRLGALASAGFAGLVVGPLAGAHVFGGSATPFSVWGAHTGFFIVAGQLTAWIVRRSRHADERAMAMLNAQRDSALAAVAEREELGRQLIHRATHDELTDLPNRSLFLHRLEEALAEAGGIGIGVLFIDLDDFKTVNDSLGHAAGDELLTAVARRLQNAVRDNDLVARFGGDEFAVLLTGLDSPNARGAAARIVGVLRAPFALQAGMASGAGSGGLAVSDQLEGDDLALLALELMRRADLAMYSAKAAGGGDVIEFHSQLEQTMLERIVIGEDLHRALVHDQFLLAYQPIVDLRSGQVTSVEALLRWQHPDRGLVTPATFVEIAERNGVIVPIGQWVLEQVCHDMGVWDRAVPGSDLTVSVNLSARQLRERGIVPAIARTLFHAGVDPRRIVLEITETLLMEDGEAAVATLWQLRALGFRIAVDDFGTGYSSLSRLVDLPIDEMKIDRSFVAELERSDAGATIITAAVAMGHGLNLTVVAEGVETHEQLEFLRRAGCDSAQGYLFGMPVAAEEVEALAGKPLVAGARLAALPRPRSVVEPDESYDSTAAAAASGVGAEPAPTRLRSARPSRSIVPQMPRGRS